MIQPAPRRHLSLSPLRYPGGKAALASFFETTIHSLGLNRPVYVEPYAGGAGAALDLLFRDVVGRIVINDLDVSIYSMWYAMVFESDRFLRRLERAPLNIDEWKRQREIFRLREKRSLDIVDLGFATFFLNRTNRSGVLRGGVIGGLEQSGKYKLDARFNKNTLRTRIERVAEHRPRISVTNQDGVARLRHWLPKSGVFAYVDPPYFVKGSSLYLNSFGIDDHARLAKELNQYANCNWVLTYDTADEIRALYKSRHILEYQIDYSAHKRESARELMITSDTVATSITN